MPLARKPSPKKAGVSALPPSAFAGVVAPVGVVPDPAAPIPVPCRGSRDEANATTQIRAEIVRGGQGALVITLPLAAARYLGLNLERLAVGQPTLHFLPINGVIQVSAGEPGAVIPAMAPNAEDYEAQLG